MPPSGITAMQDGAMWNVVTRTEAPWLSRFLGKLVLDILPAALASVIGGFLFTQYHFGLAAARPPAEQAAPASAEMMAMVRDEHAQIMNFLKAQMAAEQQRNLAEDADAARAASAARAAADTKLADALMVSRVAAQQSAAPRVLAKAVTAHRRPPAVIAAAAPHAPLTIAQASPAPNDAVVASAAPGERFARDPDSLVANPLIAKTLDIKDHVVAATRHVVSVIGDMFASVGDSIGGAMSGTRQFSSAS